MANFASPDLLAHPFTRQLWHALPEHGFTVTEEEEACRQPAEEGALPERSAEGAAGPYPEGASSC